jgi:hypothetical protein
LILSSAALEESPQTVSIKVFNIALSIIRITCIRGRIAVVGILAIVGVIGIIVSITRSPDTLATESRSAVGRSDEVGNDIVLYLFPLRTS